eukprot:762914-Hanusia_phi.AAC.3
MSDLRATVTVTVPKTPPPSARTVSLRPVTVSRSPGNAARRPARARRRRAVTVFCGRVSLPSCRSHCHPAGWDGTRGQRLAAAGPGPADLGVTSHSSGPGSIDRPRPGLVTFRLGSEIRPGPGPPSVEARIQAPTPAGTVTISRRLSGGRSGAVTPISDSS